MDDQREPLPDNPMQHPEEQPAGTEAPFKLGSLLLLLAAAVAAIALLALASASYFA